MSSSKRIVTKSLVVDLDLIQKKKSLGQAQIVDQMIVIKTLMTKVAQAAVVMTLTIQTTVMILVRAAKRRRKAKLLKWKSTRCQSSSK